MQERSHVLTYDDYPPFWQERHARLPVELGKDCFEAIKINIGEIREEENAFVILGFSEKPENVSVYVNCKKAEFDGFGGLDENITRLNGYRFRIDKDSEFSICSQNKENRGKCTIHLIRNVVLEELVLTAIRNVAEYISQFEPVFLYLFAKQHKLSKQHNLKMAKQNLEQSKMRIAEIDRVLTKLYEDYALGKISDERFERLSSTYELEQKELCEAISKAEQDIENAEQENVDLKVFLQTIRQCTDLKELTPTIVNTLIKRIDVHNPDEKFKHRRVKIDIYFTAVGLISIPDEKEILSLMDEIRNEKSA